MSLANQNYEDTNESLSSLASCRFEKDWQNNWFKSYWQSNIIQNLLDKNKWMFLNQDVIVLRNYF